MNAARPVPSRYSSNVVTSSRLRPSRSDILPNTSAPTISPTRYTDAISPTSVEVMSSVSGLISTPVTELEMVICSPSRIQAAPSPATIRVWKGLQPSRSSRAGTVERIGTASLIVMTTPFGAPSLLLAGDPHPWPGGGRSRNASGCCGLPTVRSSLAHRRSTSPALEDSRRVLSWTSESAARWQHVDEEPFFRRGRILVVSNRRGVEARLFVPTRSVRDCPGGG